MKSVLTYVRRTALRRDGADMGDGDLLGHFLARRDDAGVRLITRAGNDFSPSPRGRGGSAGGLIKREKLRCTPHFSFRLQQFVPQLLRALLSVVVARFLDDRFERFLTLFF